MLRRTLLAMLLFVSVSILAAEQIQESLPRDFFALLKKGKQDEAVLLLRWAAPGLAEDKAKFETATKQFVDATGTLGPLHGCEKLGHRRLIDRYEIAQFLCLYERTPIRVQFDFYRPKTEWKLAGFSFDSKADDLIEEQINRDIRARSAELK